MTLQKVLDSNIEYQCSAPTMWHCQTIVSDNDYMVDHCSVKINVTGKSWLKYVL